MSCIDYRVLTAKEIVGLLPEEVFSRDAKKNRKKLDEEIVHLPPGLRQVIDFAVERKQALRLQEAQVKEEVRAIKKAEKRKRETMDRATSRKAARGIDEVGAEIYAPDILKFLNLPTYEQRKERHSAFIQRTSNQGLKMEVCVSCAREMWACEGEWRKMKDVPNRERLVPVKAHPAHALHEELLVVADKIKTDAAGDPEGWFCQECHDALRRNKLPPLALANKMWIGTIPDPLRDLTVPEQMLIALHYPRCFVYKLFPKDGGRRDPSVLQRGMKGNVSTYELNIGDVGQMLDGKLLPRKPDILASVIAVAFIGRGPLPRHWLKSVFRVRREYVRRALLWLQDNNPHYADLEIDKSRLESLPEDDVPDEIVTTVRQEADETVIEREQEAPYAVPEDEVVLPDERSPEDSQDNGESSVSGHAAQWTNLTVHRTVPDSEFGVEATGYPQGSHEAGPTPSEEADKTAPARNSEEDDGKEFAYLFACCVASNTHFGLKADGSPDVVPLQYLGVCNTDLSKASTHELMMYALANLQDEGQEGAYAVRHAARPTSDFGRAPKTATAEVKAAREEGNPMPAAFPVLFPYGEGGFEASRPVAVSFLQHIRWALQYYDRRFATHHSFPFVAFGIVQKREALRTVKAHMLRRDFERDGRMLATITVEDLKRAEEEERNGEPFSNPAIKVLKKHVRAVGSKVVGSDQARAGYRAQIWGTSVMKNPPTLWVTINPVDIHDPIAQVFCGEEIDMDTFIKSAGLDSHKRAQNIAKNPYAAAKFFHFLITAILETLFGINVKGLKVKVEMGVLGRVSAYFGVVEAQGRGTLHLHMLIWLENAPTVEEMHERLATPEFRQKITEYIKANIRAHIDGLTKETMKQMPRDKELPFSRPPDPTKLTDEEYINEVASRERMAVRSAQLHTCKTSTCLVLDRKTGKHRCKRRAPFPLADNDWVDIHGNWGPKRTEPYLNAWLPDIILAAACNCDAKILTNGRETKDIAWYSTCYQTKKQQKTHNMSALLAQGVAYHVHNQNLASELRDRNRLLLFRCFQALNREAEFSGPQVMMYLMGWGDTFRSHKYIPIYWSSVTSRILREFPQLRKQTS